MISIDFHPFENGCSEGFSWNFKVFFMDFHGFSWCFQAFLMDFRSATRQDCNSDLALISTHGIEVFRLNFEQKSCKSLKTLGL